MARTRKASPPREMTQDRKDRENEIKRMQNQGAAVKVDRAGRILSAYRSNAFNLLLERRSITPNHHDAAQRLCEDWAAWKAMDGGGEQAPERVDGGSSCGPKALVNDRMLKAGRRVGETLNGIEPAQRAVLEALVHATVEEDRPMAWRGLVQKTVGETVRDRQTALVVAALESLRRAYEDARTQDRVAA